MTAPDATPAQRVLVTGVSPQCPEGMTRGEWLARCWTSGQADTGNSPLADMLVGVFADLDALRAEVQALRDVEALAAHIVQAIWNASDDIVAYERGMSRIGFKEHTDALLLAEARTMSQAWVTARTADAAKGNTDVK